MLFGDRLKELREKAGLTQSELGKLIGSSDRVVGYYEANDRFPRKAKTLQKISEVFKVSVDYLLGNEGAFLQKPIQQFGYTGGRQAQEVLNDVQILFTSGQLPEDDQEEFFRLITDMYFEAKKNNKKYGRNKYNA